MAMRDGRIMMEIKVSLFPTISIISEISVFIIVRDLRILLCRRVLLGIRRQ